MSLLDMSTMQSTLQTANIEGVVSCQVLFTRTQNIPETGRQQLRADKKIPKKCMDKLIVAHRTMSMHTSAGAD